MRILADIYCGAAPRSISDLARRNGVATSIAQREVQLLVVAGWVDSEPGPGRATMISPSTTLPFRAELTRILAHVAGLVPMLTDALAGDKRIEQAYIFGSWARRYHGEAGMFPRDVDLALVGNDLSWFELPEALDHVNKAIDGELQIVLLPAETFDPATTYLFEDTPLVRIK